jgi:hypothetical protein
MKMALVSVKAPKTAKFVPFYEAVSQKRHAMSLQKTAADGNIAM